MKNKASIAICAPGLNVYSETFIRAHKTLPYNVKYYYNSFLPFELEGEGILAKFDLVSKLRKKFARQFSYGEHDLRASFLKHKIDCVLAEYGPTACKILNVTKSLGLPMIVHFHGYDATEISTINYYGKTYKAVFEYCHRVIVVSSKMYQDLKKLGCPDEKLLLNIYGPDDSFFDINPAIDRPQFLAVGRFVDKKAPYLTLAAFKEVVNDFPDAKLVFVGDGPLLNTCRNLASVWELTNNVEFRGPSSPDEVKELLEQSLAFVQHSIIAENLDSEGTPVAILEAQAAGLPVLSTFHAGIPEVVQNNETGFLVEERDVEGMARNMRQLLGDFALSKRLGAAGKERIKNNFTINRHLGALQAEIDDALKYKRNS